MTKSLMAVRAYEMETAVGKGLTQAQNISMAKEEINRDWYKLSRMLREASKGKGNFGIGSATREQATVMGEAWVGEGYKISSNGKAWISANRTRQYRPATYKPHLNKYQANFEKKLEGGISKTWQSNAHLDIIEQ